MLDNQMNQPEMQARVDELYNINGDLAADNYELRCRIANMEVTIQDLKSDRAEKLAATKLDELLICIEVDEDTIPSDESMEYEICLGERRYNKIHSDVVAEIQRIKAILKGD